MTLTIRKADRTDAPMLAAIEMMTAPEFATFLLDGLFDCSAGAALAQIYARGGVDSWEWSWIAELDGEPAGAIGAYPVCLVAPSTDTGEAAERLAHFAPIRAAMRGDAFNISRLGVLPQYRRRGVASALVAAATQAAGAHGEHCITLFVWADNREAIALYERLGFSEMGRAEIAPHPRLMRSGTSLMLGKMLA